jgi:hypothetical protein
VTLQEPGSGRSNQSMLTSLASRCLAMAKLSQIDDLKQRVADALRSNDIDREDH